MPRSPNTYVQKTLAIVAFLLLAFGMVSFGRHLSHQGWDEIQASCETQCPKASRGECVEKVLPYACGRDFNSYYYAVQVAKKGENPYKTKALTQTYRKDDGRSGGVQPFFYPPPYLLSMAWAISMDAATAYKSFYWAGALFLISVFLALFSALRLFEPFEALICFV